MLKLDKWLSDQLGYSAYNIIKLNLNNFKFLLPKSKKILITIKSEKKISKNFLKKNKIKLVETKIKFFKKLNKSQNTNSKIPKDIRLAKRKDKKSLLDIAQDSFTKSRFFRDKRIGKNIAKKINGNWILNFFNKKRGDYLIVINYKKKVAGFLLILKNKNNYIIDLIAVKNRYKNLGCATKMLDFFQHYILKKRSSFIFASTQSINDESIRFYRKNKFRIKKKEYIYHYFNFKNY